MQIIPSTMAGCRGPQDLAGGDQAGPGIVPFLPDLFNLITLSWNIPEVDGMALDDLG